MGCTHSGREHHIKNSLLIREYPDVPNTSTNSVRDVKDAVPYEHKKLTSIIL